MSPSSTKYRLPFISLFSAIILSACSSKIIETKETNEMTKDSDTVVSLKKCSELKPDSEVIMLHKLAGMYSISSSGDTSKYASRTAYVFRNPFYIKMDCILEFDEPDGEGHIQHRLGDTPVWVESYKVEDLHNDNFRLRFLSKTEEEHFDDSLRKVHPYYQLYFADHDINQYNLKPIIGNNVDVKIDTTALPNKLTIYLKDETLEFNKHDDELNE